MTVLRKAIGLLPTDAGSYVNITIPGRDDKPTGAVIHCVDATILGSASNDLIHNVGYTDFTNGGNITISEKDIDAGEGLSATRTSESSPTHTGWPISMPIPGSGNTQQFCTVEQITGGVKITCLATDTKQYYFTVDLVFESACKMFSGGNAVAEDATFQIAHGFSNAPSFGFYSLSHVNGGNSGEGRLSMGFHAYRDSTIEQAAWGLHLETLQTVTNNSSRNSSSRVGLTVSNTGAEIDGVELTALDATNVTFTVRAGALTGQMQGLLVEGSNVDAKVDIIDSPVSASSDWDYSGLPFELQYVALICNRNRTENASETGGHAAPFSFFSHEEETGAEMSACGTSQTARDLSIQNGIASSRMNTGLFLSTQGGIDATVELQNLQPTEDGWRVIAADITTADSTARKWPMLAVQVKPPGNVNTVTLTDAVNVTDPQDCLTNYQRRPGDKIENFADAMFLHLAHARLVQDYFSIEDQMVLEHQLRKTLTDAATVEDALAILRQSFRELTDYITLSDGFQKVVTIWVAPSVTVFRQLTDQLGVSDSQQKIVTTASKTTFRDLVDQLSVSDGFQKVTIAAGKTVFQVLADYITVTDGFQKIITIGLAPSKTVTKVLTDQVSVSDDNDATFLGIHPRQLTDSISINEAEVIQRNLNRSLESQIDTFSRMLSITSKIRLDTVAVTDNVRLSRPAILNTAVLSDALDVTDGFDIRLPPSVKIVTGIEAQ